MTLALDQQRRYAVIFSAAFNAFFTSASFFTLVFQCHLPPWRFIGSQCIDRVGYPPQIYKTQMKRNKCPIGCVLVYLQYPRYANRVGINSASTLHHSKDSTTASEENQIIYCLLNEIFVSVY